MLKSRYLLLLSAFFISTFAIPTLAHAGECGIYRFDTGFLQYADHNEFLYDNLETYREVQNNHKMQKTTTLGKVYECDTSDKYCPDSHIQTMEKNHVFKGKEISEQKTYFCWNNEWIAVNLSDECEANTQEQKRRAGNKTFEHKYNGKTYILWQNSQFNRDNIQGCIKSETNTSTTQTSDTSATSTGTSSANNANNGQTADTNNNADANKPTKTVGQQCDTDDLKKQNATAGVYTKNGKDITCFATECPNGAYLVKKANVEQGYCRTPTKCAADQEPNIIDDKYIDINNQCKNKTADEVEEADEEEDNEQKKGENTSIFGRITEPDGLIAISGAQIKITGTNISTTSSNAGTFSLQNVPANAQLEISHTDYETKTVTPDPNANMNISLTKKTETPTKEDTPSNKNNQDNSNSGNNNSNTNGNQTPVDGTDCTTEKNNPAVKNAVYKSGTCVATACNDGYYLTDGNCANINGSPCDNLPTNATAGKREYNAATKETTCIVTACDKYYIVSEDKKSCEKDPEQEIQELKDKAQAAKDKEQSTENKLLGAIGIGATGIGGMQLASALAEQSADAAALTDMTAYLETFKCTYGNNASVSGGTANIETPGGNSLLPLYTEYVSLANDLKLRKNMLGMSAGIESQAILSSANGNLYNNDTTDKTTGAYASLARALSDPTGADAQKLAQQQTETADKLKTGAIVAGVGAIGSLAGNLIINKDKYFNKDGEYKSVCDYETDSHTNCITYFNNTPLSKKDKDIMSVLSIAYLKKVKGHDATCDKSDIHSTNKRAYIKCASTDGKYDWEIKFTINDDLNSAVQKKNIFSTVCKMYTGTNASDKTCSANETQCNEITNTMSAMDYTTTYNSNKCELK